jgi:hypothetical protein
MTSWGATQAATEEQPVRRVREEVRDGLAVIVVSAAASTAVAIVLTLVTKFAG